MSENKKQGNAQIPREAIKGAADTNANISATCMSMEQILDNSEKEVKFKTEATNTTKYDLIKNKEIIEKVEKALSGIKAYDNNQKRKGVDR